MENALPFSAVLQWVRLRLRRLNLQTLAYMRSRGDQIETFKILSVIHNNDCTEGLFELREHDTTWGNTRNIYKTRARLDLRKYSFPHRVVNNWNNLPELVVSTNSGIAFESRLDNFWKDQDQKFNYKAKINNTTRSQRSQVNISIQDAIPEPQALQGLFQRIFSEYL